eukprot:scaffold242221_cov14-Tisochrysis_lutea.AAC.1
MAFSVQCKDCECRAKSMGLTVLMYGEPSIALNCGSMLRDCIRDESLARFVHAVAHRRFLEHQGGLLPCIAAFLSMLQTMGGSECHGLLTRCAGL